MRIIPVFFVCRRQECARRVKPFESLHIVQHFAQPFDHRIPGPVGREVLVPARKEQAFAAEDIRRLRVVQRVPDLEHFMRRREVFRAQAPCQLGLGLAVNIADAQDLIKIAVHAQPPHLIFQFSLFGHG